MRKLIAAINMTLDGFCDHTAVSPDEKIHQHYVGLLDDAGAILYGRKTYELMKYWQNVLANPTGEKAMDDFAVAIDKIPKIVFSRTMTNPDWESATLASREPEVEIAELMGGPGKDILVGSPGLIADLTEGGLIDEFQICVHPVIAGSGLPLFRNLTEKKSLKLTRTKQFDCGAIILYYVPAGH